MRSSNSLVSMVLRKVSIIPEMALASEGVTAPSANADCLTSAPMEQISGIA